MLCYASYALHVIVWITALWLRSKDPPITLSLTQVWLRQMHCHVSSVVFSFRYLAEELFASILQLHALVDCYIFVPGKIFECAECCVTFVALNVWNVIFSALHELLKQPVSYWLHFRSTAPAPAAPAPVATSTPKRPRSPDDDEASAGKRVRFGPDISPELFDTSLSASTPVRQGGRTPTSPGGMSRPVLKRPAVQQPSLATLTSSTRIAHGNQKCLFQTTIRPYRMMMMMMMMRLSYNINVIHKRYRTT